MINNSYHKEENKSLSKAIIIGVVSGSLIGALLGFLHEYGLLIIPVVSSIFLVVPMNAIVTGTLVGIVVGVVISGLISYFSTINKPNIAESSANSGKLKLHEERLDITKKRVQTAEVNMHKEIYTEEKTFTVPITHEDLIIEKKSMIDDKAETIRIPIKEERVEIVKHPVALEDVTYHIEQFQENKCIEETIKKENLKIDYEGSAKIIDKEIKTPDLS